MNAKVYEAIAAVMADISKEGVSKDRKNQQQGYKFRGIDDLYNALSPILARNKLCMLPSVIERQCEERATKNGGTLFYTTVLVEFALVSAEDGSIHTIRTYGEAMDSADKSTNKAMSAAYKYAAMMAFCVPTEGDNDADAHTPEPINKDAHDMVTFQRFQADISNATTRASAHEITKRGTQWASSIGRADFYKAIASAYEAVRANFPEVAA